ncbi:hypothetical protein EVAR_101713_1 [Eumeta japonica]|uniref:Uncharacterized protein n=1 Tax=Eumeta variegata TaxID=151549 RepID=A0A4C1TL16_EUMVA|nr:hypothetical protein EVAR_101713_1 [Eumeta japonica]
MSLIIPYPNYNKWQWCGGPSGKINGGKRLLQRDPVPLSSTPVPSEPSYAKPTKTILQNRSTTPGQVLAPQQQHYDIMARVCCSHFQ